MWIHTLPSGPTNLYVSSGIGGGEGEGMGVLVCGGMDDGEGDGEGDGVGDGAGDGEGVWLAT